METLEYRTIDKSAWGDGPWQSEPDKRQWRDDATGLPCLIVRNPSGGNLCGYVGVPASHPFHGIGYGDRAPTLPCGEYCSDDHHYSCSPSAVTEVHGGLTFSDGCRHGGDPSKGICHVPGSGEPDDIWWFGFDCAHCDDLSPGYLSRYPSHRDPTDIYRDAAYVATECASLARQLAALVAA